MSFSRDQFLYFWRWKCKLPERHGQKCRVLSRGKLNSAKIQFEDGYIVISSRYAVRLITPITKPKCHTD